MKTKIKIGTIPIIIMGLILFLTNSCQKEEEPNDNITDKDGNIYTAVTIGTQVWMVENLKTTKYNDGTAIPLVTDNTAWANLTNPGYCYYDNDATTYKNPYGALYNWYAVSTGKLCPSGWHVPTDAEWHTLILNLDAIAQSVEGWESDIAGGKLKETGTTHWAGINIDATNESGFTALPGGFRAIYGDFNVIQRNGYWWSVTEDDAIDAWDRRLENTHGRVMRTSYRKTQGFSVRCIKD